jgi:hypothetical protein
MLNNRQQRLEGFKPSKRYNTLTINLLVSILFCRLFNINHLYFTSGGFGYNWNADDADWANVHGFLGMIRSTASKNPEGMTLL